MLLPPLEFLFKACLNWDMAKQGRLELARIVGRGEPCVRGWQRKKRFPPFAIEKLLGHFENNGSVGFSRELANLWSEPILAGNEAMQNWRIFCLGCIEQEDFLWLQTVKEILSFSTQWTAMYSAAQESPLESRFGVFKEFLGTVVGPKFGLPMELSEEIQGSSDWDGLRPALTWLVVESFLYFMSLAEAEYIEKCFLDKGSIVAKKMLPKMKDEKVQSPVKLFFDSFFDRLVERGFYSTLDEIAQRMPRILPGDEKVRVGERKKKTIDYYSGRRELSRAKYEGKAPSLETFRAWIEVLIPAAAYPDACDPEGEKQAMFDAFVVARILDKFFREIQVDVPAEQLIEQFGRYEAWYHYHRSVLTEGRA